MVIYIKVYDFLYKADAIWSELHFRVLLKSEQALDAVVKTFVA